ncbi:MAG: type II secretion system protein [Acidobacteriota bacterium]
MRQRRQASGFSFVELIIVVALMAILASVTLPTVKFTEKRLKEMELRGHLREMRGAIDEYKRYSDSGFIPIDLGTDGYPKELEVLIEGIEIVGQIDTQIRFLRRIPIDPMTGEEEWGLRSYQDDVDASSWGGENVYDVYSLSEGVGLNGIPYSEW